MKLSLVFPSWFTAFGAFREAAQKVSTFPPLNLCLLAALAKRVGWDVQLIDAHIEGLDDTTLLNRLAQFKPDLIGLTATTPFYPNAARLARVFKKELGKPLLMGGPHVTYYGQKAFADCFDYLFIGECEAVFGDFLRQYEKGHTTPHVYGVMMQKGSEVIYHGPSPILSNLDDLPFPDRSQLKNELYVLGTPLGNKCYTAIQMSRGCPFSCVFCASELYGKHVRFRSVANVITELKSVLTNYGAEHIYFVDDVFTLNRKYIMELCDAIQSQKLKFTFESSSRANLWDEEMVQRLKDCGLVRMSFGLESADEKVREIIKKEIPLDSYVEANKLNQRLGIETTNSVIIGLPGDTRASIERTVSYLCSHREIQHVTLNVAVPYPGTEMLRMAEQGLHGLKLVEHDFAKYQRYGSAVMEVNELSAAELIALQRKALFRIYACWWRWIPTLKRFGIKTILITALNTILSGLKSKQSRATLKASPN